MADVLRMILAAREQVDPQRFAVQSFGRDEVAPLLREPRQRVQRDRNLFVVGVRAARCDAQALLEPSFRPRELALGVLDDTEPAQAAGGLEAVLTGQLVLIARLSIASSSAVFRSPFFS